MGEHPDTSVELAFVIVSYNSASDLRICVASIVKYFGGDSGSSWRIVIVDNGSSDDSVALIHELESTCANIKSILLDENIGFGPANNRAFQSIAADYYVLINADAWFLADSVSPAMRVMSDHPDMAICGLPLVYPDGTPQTHAFSFSSWKRWLLQLIGVRDLVGWLLRFHALSIVLGYVPYATEFVRSQSRSRLHPDRLNGVEYSGALRDVDWTCGAAMILQGRFVRESGGFDPKIFLYGEDEDLCISAHQQGQRVMVVDTVPVVHVFGWGKNRFNETVAELKYASLQYFISKHYTGMTARMMRLILPVQLFGWRFWRRWLR